MMAKPIKSLISHYPMIKFLSISFIQYFFLYLIIIVDLANEYMKDNIFEL